MDNKQSLSRRTRIIDILEKNNYYVKYEFNSLKINELQVYVSWLNKVYNIKLDLLDSNLAYVYPSLLYIKASEFMKNIKFPTFWIKMVVDKREVQNFPVFTSYEKSEILLKITKNIFDFGLLKEDIDLAKNNNILDGLSVVTRSFLSIDIKYAK